MSIKNYIRKIEIRLEIFALNIFMYMVLTEIYLLAFYIKVRDYFKGE